MKATLKPALLVPPPPGEVTVTMTEREAEYVFALLGKVERAGWPGAGQACYDLYRALDSAGVRALKFDRCFYIQDNRLSAKEDCE